MRQMKRTADMTEVRGTLPRREFIRGLAGGAVALGSGPIVAGCGGGNSQAGDNVNRIFGPDAVRVSLQDFSVSAVRLGRAYVGLSPAGQPVEVGFELLDGALADVPATDYNIPAVFRADMPAEAAGTPFRQLGLSKWTGHDPRGIGEVPHFHAVFLLQPVQFPSPNLVRELTPVAAREVAPGFIDGRSVPTAVVPGVGNGFEDPSFPHMNPHWFGLTYNYFYYDGHMNGMGIGVTIDFLATNESQSMTIAQPALYPKAGVYPNLLTARHDATLQAYLIVLSDLRAATQTI